MLPRPKLCELPMHETRFELRSPARPRGLARLVQDPLDLVLAGLLVQRRLRGRGVRGAHDLPV